MRKAHIYKITLPYKDSKVYIGSTVNAVSREKQHIVQLTKGNHHSKKLQLDYNNNNCNGINFELIEECSQDNRNEREQVWIDMYESVYFGYNMVDVDVQSVLTRERRLIERIDNIERYEELEYKILDMFRAWRGINTFAYCDIRYNKRYSRFCLYEKTNKRTDNQIISTCIENIDAFQRMLNDWYSSKEYSITLRFQKDSSYVKVARNHCNINCYRNYGLSDYTISSMKSGVTEDLTKDVSSVIAQCLGEYDSNSIYSRLMQNITAMGYDMIEQIPITRRNCKNGHYPFTVDYLTNAELKKLDVLRKEGKQDDNRN